MQLKNDIKHVLRGGLQSLLLLILYFGHAVFACTHTHSLFSGLFLTLGRTHPGPSCRGAIPSFYPATTRGLEDVARRFSKGLTFYRWLVHRSRMNGQAFAPKSLGQHGNLDARGKTVIVRRWRRFGDKYKLGR